VDNDDRNEATEVLDGMNKLSRTFLALGYDVDTSVYQVSDTPDAQVVHFEPEADIVDGAGRPVGRIEPNPFEGSEVR
jgi:hypothetical protein